MDLLGALRVFIRVAETGSFSAVSRERDVSQTAVARQISQLEEHFGIRLFHRTTRKLSLTDDGDTLLGHGYNLLNEADQLEAALGEQRSSPAGLVRIGHPVAATRFLAPRVPVLLARHPGLKIELVVSDQHGDMVADRLDLAMRTGEVADRSLIVRHAGEAQRIVVASPSYLERRGAPAVPDELVQHTCIVHNHGPRSDLWTFDESGKHYSVRVAGGLIANDAIAVHLAVRSGYGIAFLPLVQIIDDLMNRDLLPILGDFPAAGTPVSLVYPSRRHLALRTRAVLDFILDELKRSLATIAAAAVKVGYAGLAKPPR